MNSSIPSEILKLIRSGDKIEAKATIEIPDEEGHLRRSVTAGKQYPVAVYAREAGSIVRIVGDTGIPHEITGDYIMNFKWVPRDPSK